MNGRDRTDFAIVGGGLSGALIALALRKQRPELSVLLLEGSEELCGNHRWSWFASDLPPGGEALLAPLRKAAWDMGYEVRFPAHRRLLSSPYRSLSSVDLAAALRRELPEGSIRTKATVVKLHASGVELESGEQIAARVVIDCRGSAPSRHLQGGWQVFLGRHMRTDRPHGLVRPIIMDACVEQTGGYRFVYVLPLAHDELFIEDTYYADEPTLDRRTLGARIESYCANNGWTGELLGNEAGVLPVITGGDYGAYRESVRTPGVALAGARGLFVHPLTSYTLPHAVKIALTVAAEADLAGEQLAALLDARASAHWRATGFYRVLGRMLFGAARPKRRYLIFRRFYSLSEPLIERFYAARSTLIDKFRIVAGKPPVAIGAALRALLAPGARMAQSHE